MTRVRVLLADDHTMLREGLRRSLEADGFDVVGEACDGLEAVRLAGLTHPQVVLMDVSMPAMDGIEAARIIHEQQPDVAVVMLTMHPDEDLVAKAVKYGAAGYLVKDCTSAEVSDAVMRAADGETALSAGLASGLLDVVREQPGEQIISRREEEVLQLIAEGASTTEVASRLYISAKTVKNHLASIYQKLGARDRTQAVLNGARLGIIRLT
jgi:two-component system, NarL family, response regulator DegU